MENILKNGKFSKKQTDKCCYQNEFASVLEKRFLVKLCRLVEHVFEKLILEFNKDFINIASYSN